MPPRPKRLQSSMIKRPSRKTLPTQASGNAGQARAKTLTRATKGTNQGLSSRARPVTPKGSVGRRLSSGEAPKIAKRPVGQIPNSRLRGATLPATAKKPITTLRGKAPPTPKTPPSGIGGTIGSNRQSAATGLYGTPKAVRGISPGERRKAGGNITANRSRSSGNKRR